jgi:hypothetical protein
MLFLQQPRQVEIVYWADVSRSATFGPPPVARATRKTRPLRAFAISPAVREEHLPACAHAGHAFASVQDLEDRLPCRLHNADQCLPGMPGGHRFANSISKVCNAASIPTAKARKRYGANSNRSATVQTSRMNGEYIGHAARHECKRSGLLRRPARITIPLAPNVVAHCPQSPQNRFRV